MYVEPVGNKSSVVVGQTAQTEVDKKLRKESRDGDAKKAEVKIKESNTSEKALDEQRAVQMEKLKKAVELMSEQLPHSEPKFGIHEETNRIMIKLVDKDTQEVIKEIPPEKSLDMLAKAMEIAGVLMDEKL